MARIRNQITYEIKADPSDFLTDMKKVNRSWDKTQDNLREGARAGVSGAGAAAAGGGALGRGLGSAGMVAGAGALLKSAAPLLAGGAAVAGVIGLSRASMRAATEINQLKVMLSTFYREEGEAAKIFEETAKSALVTPFSAQEFIAARSRMKAFNLDDSIKDLELYGDAAYVMNQSLLDVVNVMGRLRSGQFGEGFERLRDFGFSREQAEARGLQFNKGGQFQGTSQQAIAGVQDYFRTQFGGAGRKGGEQFDVMLQNMLAAWELEFLGPLGQSIGDTLVPAFSDFAEAMLPVAKDLIPVMVEGLTALADTLTVLSPAIVFLAEMINGLLRGVQLVAGGIQKVGQDIADSFLGDMLETLGVGDIGTGGTRREENAAIADLEARLAARGGGNTNITINAPVGVGMQSGLALGAGA